MTQQMSLGSTFSLLDESMTMNRMGYSVMQLGAMPTPAWARISQRFQRTLAENP